MTERPDPRYLEILHGLHPCDLRDAADLMEARKDVSGFYTAFVEHDVDINRVSVTFVGYDQDGNEVRVSEVVR